MDEALAAYGDVLRREPSQPAALVAVGRIALDAKDTATLAKILPALIPVAPATALAICKLLEREGRLDIVAASAAALGAAGGEGSPASAYADRFVTRLISLGRRARLEGDEAGAVRHWRLALLARPDDERPEKLLNGLFAPRTRAAAAARRDGDVAAAAAGLRAVLADDPNHLPSLRALVHLLLRAGRSDEALPHLLAYCERVPSDTAMARRAVLLAERGNALHGALGPLRRLATVEDEALRSFAASRALRIARALRKAGDHAGVAEAARIALSIEPDDETAKRLLDRARLQSAAALRTAARSRDVSLARELGQTGLSADPDNIPLALAYARLLLVARDLGAARPILEGLARAGETGYDVSAGLARARYDARDYAGTIDAAIAALAARPGDSAMMKLLGRLKTMLPPGV